ncbi:MAG TPA: DUF1499 domain-containing protein [Thermohalobaculum sp.]|nr:DUF1499 domain-containing protein [Thermohalobaculum sp.]
MRRLLRGAAAVALGALVFLIGVAVVMRVAGSDAGAWHVPLTTAERPGAPNDFLAATPGYTAATPDLKLEPGDGDAEWLRALDAVAMAEPRVERLAGGPAEGRITWVQRSAVFGFPDYITAEARGADRAVWSRARYGRNDFGVNRARVERWLARLGG